MTTKKFSAIALPHPKYSLEIGCLDLKQEDLNLPIWIPRFSDIAQIIEVRKTGSIPSRHIVMDCEFGSFILISNAHLELFLRRDFISKFVDRGTVHLVQDSKGPRTTDYQIYTSSNVLTIILGEKQYRRFGGVAKKVISNKQTDCKRYRVDVDLKDERIKESNKYQDKLIQTFRRLNPINKLYFRFVPGKSTGMTRSEASTEALEFFRYVMDEYAMDGFQPVPLAGCSKISQGLIAGSSNYSQVHPYLDIGITRDECNMDVQRNTEFLAKIVDVIDWLGYQLLSLDCDREEIRSKYPKDVERLDVSWCKFGRGIWDFEQFQNNLKTIFKDKNDDYIVLRALILYNCQDVSTMNSNVVLLQDCGRDSDANLITVIGMSGGTN